jgi:hypothetical protein
MLYGYLADVIAVLHGAYVLCVVLGLVAILVGRALGWEWVRNRWFRIAHLTLIAVVVARALIWTSCPLSWWEKDLRKLGGQVDEEGVVNYEGHRIGQFFHNAIHPEDVPEWNIRFAPWFLPTAYTLFGLLILGTFWIAPVNWRGRRPALTSPPARAGEVVRADTAPPNQGPAETQAPAPLSQV